MAIGRMINKHINIDKKVDSLSSDTCRLAFTWTIPHLDRDGRICGDPCVLKNTVFPRREDVTPEIMQGFIAEWAISGLVRWYQADGDLWLFFPGFAKNQISLRYDREAPSRCPAPDQGEQVRSNSGAGPEPVRSNSRPMEEKRREEKRIQEAPRAPDIPPFDELPPKPAPPPAPAVPVPSGPEYRKQLQQRASTAEQDGDAAAMLVYGLELLHGGPFASYPKEWASAKKLAKSLTTMSRGNGDLCAAARELLRVYQHKRRTSREAYWKEAPLTPSGMLSRLEQLVSFAGKQRENAKLDELSAKAMRSSL